MQSSQLALTQLISKVKNFVFDPTLDTLEKVEQFVLSKSNETKENTAHSFGKKIVFCVDGQVTAVENTLDESFFKSAIGMSDLESKLFEMMQNYTELETIRQITNVNVLFSGSKGKVPIGNNFQLFTLTKKTNYFFDFVAYTTNGTGIISTDIFHRNLTVGLSHSGDIGSLLHHIRINYNFPEGKLIVVGAIGYNKKPLRTFVEQTPMVCIVGDNVINLVPCPLDQVTLGNATFSGFLVCRLTKIDGQKFLEYYVLPNVVTCDGIDTGDKSQGLYNKLSPVFQTYFSTDEEKVLDETHETTEISTKKVTPDEQYAGHKTFWNVLQLVQKSLDPSKLFKLDNSLAVSFGSGIGDISEGKQTNLPCLFGQITGHPSVLLGSHYSLKELNSNEYMNLVNNKFVIVHLETNGWDDYISANTCKFVGNCLFVIHLNDNQFVNLKDLTINCLTMAGPESLVLVENDGKLYYYRGVDKFGCLPLESKNVKFGEEVKLSFDDLTLLWNNNIRGKDDSTIYSRVAGRYIAFDELKIIFNNLQLADGISKDVLVSDLIYMFKQMTVCYSSEQISEISEIIVTRLTEHKNSKINELKNQLCCLLEKSDIEGVKDVSISIRKITSEFNEDYNEVLEFINLEMVSVKGCISKNHSLERIKRKLDIKKNVGETLKMDNEELAEEVANSCKKEGVVIFNVNGESVVQNIRKLCQDRLNLANGYIDSDLLISTNYGLINAVNSFAPNERTPLLDGLTYSTIASVTKDKKRGFSFSPQSLTLPIIGQTKFGFVASLILPMFDRFVELTDPYSVNWKEVCNEPEIAHFRIALRNTFVCSTECRDFSAKPDSVEIGAMLCLNILGYIENYIKLVLNNKIPSDQTVPLRIMRGSMGFLLSFMASGVNGQLKAWELFNTEGRTSIPTSVENFDIYFRLLKVVPYCKWDQKQATKKLRSVAKYFIQKRNN